MDDNKALVLNNVAVRYRKNNSSATADIVKKFFKKSSSNDFWALKGVSFELEKGEMLGVIGKNGAGKSTLMKAISGTVTPASGEIERNGKICALLELGTGFDRDMTVKENVYLRGALLGYTKEFIDSKYEEIIDYADMREFEDNPFHTLSSGMKSRIAFAIVSMIEPEIIILDEVFAVGDGDFRKKSQQTMEKILSKGNTTALIVSHSIKTVKEQCSKVLWLHKGKMVMMGDPETVCAAYNDFLNTKKLPDTEDLRRGNGPTKNNFKRSKKRKFGELCAYLAMLLTVCVSIFLWSQHDVIGAYFTAKNTEPEALVSQIEEKRDGMCDILGIDDSDWDYGEFSELADGVLSEELSLKEAAASFTQRLEDTGNEKLCFEYAKLQTVTGMYRLKLETRLGELRKEYSALPESEKVGLLRYAYSNYHNEFFSLEKDCDNDVQDIIETMRKELISAGQPESLADELMNIYTGQKELRMAYYMAELK